jgi:endonuclease YncB( thermonuclease family)
MLPRIALAPVVALIAGFLLVMTPSAAQAADKDCGDFATQAEAQQFFLNAGGPQSDPHRLDAEGDGVACESLPCPCSTSTGGGGGSTAPAAAATLTQRAKVLKVIDGDTVDVRLKNGRKKRVRMIGIDTPEVHGRTQCGGPRASRALKQMLPFGTRVRLVSDPTQDRVDRYGRILRYVVKARTGVDMNRRQVRRGNARVYAYGGRAFKRVATYRKAQRLARAQDRGVWGRC